MSVYFKFINAATGCKSFEWKQKMQQLQQQQTGFLSFKGPEQTNDNKWFHLRMTCTKYNRLMWYKDKDGIILKYKFLFVFLNSYLK